MRNAGRVLVLVFLFFLLPRGDAANPLSYDVKLAKTGVAALDTALSDASTLVSLHGAGPIGPFALIGRARNDRTRFEDALESFGYYKGSVAITIAGKSLDDPDLPAHLAALPAKPPVAVRASFNLGPLFHLGEVTIEGTVPEEARKAFALHPGAPARASDVLAAGTRLLDALRNEGYALAKVPPPRAFLHPATNVLKVVFTVDPGPRVDLGPIRIAGLKTVNESFVRRRLTIHSGERFSPTALAKARQELAEVPVFASVAIEPANALDPAGTLPVTVRIAERKLHVVSLNGGYSTDLGVMLGASWEDRNLFGNAEDLRLSAATNIGGTAVQGLGYEVNAIFTKPDFLRRDQSLIVNLGTINQKLYAYDQVAVNAGVSLSRPVLPHLRLNVGVAAERERITQNEIGRNFTVIGLPIALAFDTTNNLLEPTKGVRASLSVTPTASFGPPSAEFLITELSASTYLDLSGWVGEKPGRSVLAVRGLIGSALGANLDEIPGDKRFYAGGSGTIRGYRYLSVGPQFPNRHPTGGVGVGAATIELRQRVYGNWGTAIFADAGDVSTSTNPFGGALRVGAGAGIRYYTPFGPIRADVAFPLTREEGGDSFELYIGLGEAF